MIWFYKNVNFLFCKAVLDFLGDCLDTYVSYVYYTLLELFYETTDMV